MNDKHADGRPQGHSEGERVLEGQDHAGGVIQNAETEASERTLDTYDATAFVGLRTIVKDAAIESTDEEGEVSIELPKPTELLASAAILRCLMPIKLRGPEMRSIRKIMGLNLAGLASALDERTAPETVSRWETEAQPMGGYVEKLFRLLVCEQLRKDAPGIEYNASMIAHLRVLDPWRANPSYEVPPVVLCLIFVKEQSGSIIEAWNEKCAA
jgi:hypothetical protein